MIWWFLPWPRYQERFKWCFIRMRLGSRSQCERRILRRIWIKHFPSHYRPSFLRRSGQPGPAQWWKWRLPKELITVKHRRGWWRWTRWCLPIVLCSYCSRSCWRLRRRSRPGTHSGVCLTGCSRGRWRSPNLLGRLSFQIGRSSPRTARRTGIRIRISTYLTCSLSRGWWLRILRRGLQGKTRCWLRS